MAGYPALRVMTLAETGTRGLLGATVGSVSDRDEVGLARRLLPLLGPGMVILLDRAFDAAAFLAEITATGAMLLARAKSTRKPPVLAHLPDGSYLSRLDGQDGPPGLGVRIIEAGVVMTGADGTRVAESYRLITTLTDHRRYRPARWCGFTMSAGRPGRPTWRCGTPCWTAACCARVTGPAPGRNCGAR
jgi:hypothetical protein